MRSEIHRLDLPRPETPPTESKVVSEDPIEEPIGVHLREGEPSVLFGTGYAESATELLDWLDQYESPEIVVVEHGDPDHYGAVPALRERFPEATIAIPQADCESLSSVGITPDVALEPGERRWGLRVLHVPGHTRGNSAFFDEETDMLFVGDTFVNCDSTIAADGDWSGPFAPIQPRFNAHDPAARRNLAVLAGLEFEAALLTHGSDVLTRGKEGLDRLIRDLELRTF